jgi:hypothetical protein
MLTHSLLKLAEVGSSPIVATFNERLFDQELTGVGHRHELKHLLGLKNGFYAFESSLHVFPFVVDNWFNHQDLHHWNLPELWKRAYTDTLDRMYAFAEDVFGYQFCSLDQKIVRFDPETGETEDLCSSLDEWAEAVLKDYNLQTGYPVAHAWQTQNGPLKRGNRLVPIYPLISKEGSYDIGNFYEVDALKGLLSRADFARQIKNIADGERVKISPINLK